MALATKYAVSTHVASSGVDARLPAICGRATLATLVSSTSMKVASITTKAITHGLMAGFSGAATSKTCGCIYFVIIVASTFIPGRRILLPPGIGSNMIFTGIRCTTFT